MYRPGQITPVQMAHSCEPVSLSFMITIAQMLERQVALRAWGLTSPHRDPDFCPGCLPSGAGPPSFLARTETHVPAEIFPDRPLLYPRSPQHFSPADTCFPVDCSPPTRLSPVRTGAPRTPALLCLLLDPRGLALGGHLMTLPSMNGAPSLLFSFRLFSLSPEWHQPCPECSLSLSALWTKAVWMERSPPTETPLTEFPSRCKNFLWGNPPGGGGNLLIPRARSHAEVDGERAGNAGPGSILTCLETFAWKLLRSAAISVISVWMCEDIEVLLSERTSMIQYSVISPIIIFHIRASPSLSYSWMFIPFYQTFPIFPTPQPLATTFFTLCFSESDFLRKDSTCKWYVQCLSCCLGYFSLTPSSCIHVVASGRTALLLVVE